MLLLDNNITKRHQTAKLLSEELPPPADRSEAAHAHAALTADQAALRAPDNHPSDATMMKKYCQNTAHAGAACVLKRSAFCFGVPMMVNSTYHHVQEDAERSHGWAGKEATQTQNGCQEILTQDTWNERTFVRTG